MKKGWKIVENQKSIVTEDVMAENEEDLKRVVKEENLKAKRNVKTNMDAEYDEYNEGKNWKKGRKIVEIQGKSIISEDWMEHEDVKKEHNDNKKQDDVNKMRKDVKTIMDVEYEDYMSVRTGRMDG